MATRHNTSLAPEAECDGQRTFATLFGEYRSRICRYLYSLVQDADLAEDLAQDTFVKAYRALAHAPSPDNAGAWLYTIATNTALSTLRRRKIIAWLRLHESPEARRRPAATDHEARTGEKDLIARALAGLPKQDAACLLLRFQQDLAYEEIARALGCSTAAARTRVCRARAAFCERHLHLRREARP